MDLELKKTLVDLFQNIIVKIMLHPIFIPCETIINSLSFINSYHG